MLSPAEKARRPSVQESEDCPSQGIEMHGGNVLIVIRHCSQQLFGTAGDTTHDGLGVTVDPVWISLIAINLDLVVKHG